MSMDVVNTVGRRKAAVARVYVKPGTGSIMINRRPLETYFPLEILQYVVKQPLLALNNTEAYDIAINLDGGGTKGQAEGLPALPPGPGPAGRDGRGRFQKSIPRRPWGNWVFFLFLIFC